jgi:hypothetical protein
VLGRKVEDCVEVVLPIGGSMEISIGVIEDGLDALELQGQDDVDVEEEVFSTVYDYLQWVSTGSDHAE